jgi:hypothetical protein
VFLSEPFVEVGSGPIAVHPQDVPANPVVGSNAGGRAEPKSPETGGITEFPDSVPGTWSEWLKEETAERVEELLSHLSRESPELVPSLLPGYIPGGHRLSAPPLQLRVKPFDR